MALGKAAGLGLAMALAASTSQAQMACAPHDAVFNELWRRFEELPAARGLTNAGVLDLTVGPDGSFTLLLTRPDGMTCLVAAGEAWGPVAAKKPKPPEEGL